MNRIFKHKNNLIIIFALSLFIQVSVCNKSVTDEKSNKSILDKGSVVETKIEKKLDDGNQTSNKLLVEETNTKDNDNSFQNEDLHYKNIVGTFSETGEEKKCNKTLLDVFSITGKKLEKEQPASFNEKLYCSRNKNTCCTAENIKSTNVNFAKGAKALKERFEVVEELFALFRGPLFQEKASKFKNYKTCSHWVNDIKIELNGETYGFFDYATQKYMRDTFESVLLRTEIYVKSNLWFYGDMICLICSPKNQDYFKLNEQTSQIDMHTNTCSEMMGERGYELRLYSVYHSYIYKIMEYIECLNNHEDDLPEEEEISDEEMKKMNEDKTGTKLFKPLNHDEVTKFSNTFMGCWDDEDVKKPECAKLCTKDLRAYKFPFQNLLHNYHASLSIMYEFMTEKTIDEYYMNIKERVWTLADAENNIAFYPANEDWQKYKMSNIEWSYSSKTGHDIYKEIMSKRYLDFQSVFIVNALTVCLTFLVSLF